MTSKVEICSNALLLLGHAPISAMGEGDRGALMQSLYDQVRRATIRGHVWHFAKESVTLAPDATPPAGEWSARFLVPGDSLRVLWVGERGEELDYEIQGRAVLYSGESLYLTYLRDVEDVNTFDATFVDALCANLAFTAAFPLTKSVELQKAMYALYTEKRREATTINGQEVPPAEISGSPLLTARRRRF